MRGHVVLMRKDPPVDTEYLHDTQVLGWRSAPARWWSTTRGACATCNEKLTALEFPQCCPPTLVTRDAGQRSRPSSPSMARPCSSRWTAWAGARSSARARRPQHQRDPGDADRSTAATWRWPSATCPEIAQGDKRILLVDGEPVDYCLARIPQGDEFRGNLAAGGRGEGRPLTRARPLDRAPRSGRR